MKVKYRGHTIEVEREKCLGGWYMTYYNVYRDSDGLECVANFSEGNDPASYWVKTLKERIDEELASNDPWDENVDAPC